MANLPLKSTLTFNKLIWLSSAGDPDTGPTDRMANDLKATADINGVDFEHIQIRDRAHFDEVMTELVIKASVNGERPLLHIDMHGCAEKGLKLSDSYIPWVELCSITGALNKATNNNLGIVGAACHAMQSARNVSINKTAPYYVLLAPFHQVTVGFLESNIVPFYQELLKTQDLDGAYKEHLSPTFGYFHCEKALANAFVRYMMHHATSQKRQERVEDLVTKVVENAPTGTQINIKKARKTAKQQSSKAAKQGLKAFGPQLDRVSDIFLAGRERSFSLDQLTTFVEEDRAPRSKRP